MNTTLTTVTRRAAIIVLIAAVFGLDAVTSADNVSICFAYAIPIVLGIVERSPHPFAYAAVSTALSVAGSFIQPPSGQITGVFIGNRIIAIAVQWLMAALVFYRHKAEEALQRSLEAERAKAHLQRRLIAILSHEVKTPLTTIDGQAYRLTKLSRAITPDDLTTRAGKIRRAVRRINDIVERIELSSAADDGEVPWRPAPLDLAGLIAEAAQPFADRPDAPPIVSDLARLPPLITGDASLLQPVFANLLSNAVKYSPGGGTVRVEGWTEGGEAVVRVHDEGMGIDAAELDNVFEPYYRGSNSGGIGGAGIGLFLVDRFVARHGGAVEVASRPGAGTTVTVRLPVSLNLPPPEPAGHAPAEDDPVHRG